MFNQNALFQDYPYLHIDYACLFESLATQVEPATLPQQNLIHHFFKNLNDQTVQPSHFNSDLQFKVKGLLEEARKMFEEAKLAQKCEAILICFNDKVDHSMLMVHDEQSAE